jgi:hypothetical protein
MLRCLFVHERRANDAHVRSGHNAFVYVQVSPEKGQKGKQKVAAT